MMRARCEMIWRGMTEKHTAPKTSTSPGGEHYIAIPYQYGAGGTGQGEDMSPQTEPGQQSPASTDQGRVEAQIEPQPAPESPVTPPHSPYFEGWNAKPTDVFKDFDMIVIDHEFENVHDTHQEAMKSPVEVETLTCTEMPVVTNTDPAYTYHANMLHTCNENWEKASQGKYDLPALDYVACRLTDSSTTLPKKAKKKFINRLSIRRKTLPYPPLSELKGDEVAVVASSSTDQVVQAQKPTKGAKGLLRRLSLRRPEKSLSFSTPKKSVIENKDVKDKKVTPSIFKRLSLRRRERSPVAKTAPTKIKEKTAKAASENAFRSLLRKLSLRKRKPSRPVPIPEIIITAVEDSHVDGSLDNSDSSIATTNDRSRHGAGETTTDSLRVMQGSCGTFDDNPCIHPTPEYTNLEQLDRCPDTSITFSAGSLPLPENTKSPPTRKIYQTVFCQNIIGKSESYPEDLTLTEHGEDEPLDSVAMESFSFGDSTQSATAFDQGDYTEDSDEDCCVNPHLLSTEDAGDRSRPSLYEELGAVGGLTPGGEECIRDRSTLYSDIYEIKTILQSLWSPLAGRERADVPGAPVEEDPVVSVEDIDVAVGEGPRPVSPGQVDSYTMLNLCDPQPEYNSDSSSNDYSPHRSTDIAHLIANTSENAQKYYSIASASLSPSESDSNPCTPSNTPSTQSGLKRFETRV